MKDCDYWCPNCKIIGLEEELKPMMVDESDIPLCNMENSEFNCHAEKMIPVENVWFQLFGEINGYVSAEEQSIVETREEAKSKSLKTSNNEQAIRWTWKQSRSFSGWHEKQG